MKKVARVGVKPLETFGVTDLDRAVLGDALVRVAKILDYRVAVGEARAVFTTAARFPEADEVVVQWPQRHLARAGE